MKLKIICGLIITIVGAFAFNPDEIGRARMLQKDVAPAFVGDAFTELLSKRNHDRFEVCE